MPGIYADVSQETYNKLLDIQEDIRKHSGKRKQIKQILIDMIESCYEAISK